MLTIKKVSPQHPQAQALISKLDAYLNGLYPAERNYLDSVDELSKAHVLFVGAFDEEALVGCGAVKIMEGGYGEIKRVFVRPDYRGQGISRRIMDYLEQHLVERGIPLARLETGIHQTEAIGLYRKIGYVTCGSFGDYRDDPLSLFMEKRLTRQGSG